MVALYTHLDMFDHRPGNGHPERPERLRAVADALNDATDLDLEPREAPQAEIADLERVHPAAYVEAMLAASPASGRTRLDADTVLSPGSIMAARRAAGAVVAAVRSVAAGEETRAFCAVRPPGHHAEPDTPMGFCIFSNVAVAARAAQAAGLARVAVVDFDVHHGNGTQAAFEADPTLFLASIHQRPLYPGTGDPSEKGVGNIANGVVGPHAPREKWRAVFEGLLDKVDAFAPDLILISAGFDAHARDPLASQSLEAEDFAWATSAVVAVANARARGRIVSSLEGGYDLEALGRSAVAHVRALQAG
ncbi:MAG TPA: histone deacetylase family protein [Caulobacteraceae bacterium]|nr:histone deacetylase family protein [Caulobacteraceae bacterium]